MLSPTLPAWCENLFIPDNILSPALPSIYDKNAKQSPRGKSLLRHESSRGDTPLSDSDSETIPTRPPSLIVTLKIANIASLRKVTTEKSKPKKRPIQKKRLLSDNLSEPPKKTRISRSYSSSEESDPPTTTATPTIITTPTPTLKKTMRANLPPRPTTAPTTTATVTNNTAPSLKSTSASTTSTSPEARTTNASTPVRTKPRLSQEQRNSHNKLLMMKMSRWSHLARNQKHESDKYSKSKPLVAGVIAMDALLAYIVAFDYEDRAEIVMQRIKHTRSWSTLIPYIGWLINLLEEGDCRELIGMCYQIRALVHLRMVSSYQEQTLRLLGNKKYEEMAEITGKLIKSQDSSIQDFKRGMRDLGMDKIEERFPNTWKAREKRVQPVSRHEGGYRPLEDPYYLPLHGFSSLQEGAALGYSVTKEWADEQGIECDWALVRGLVS